MPSNFNYEFQNANSNLMEHLIFFHDHIMMIIIMNMILITYWILTQLKNPLIKTNEMENNETEIFWTITPMVMLIFMSMPSMLILYMTEETQKPNLTVKATSSQWYWSYEYPEISNSPQDSFMKKTLESRLISSSNNMIAPSNMWIRLITSSNDVIHSWTIPSLGVKMDSIPGRLNTNSMIFKRSGILIGQCSEICGANHSFMPIVLNSINPTFL